MVKKISRISKIVILSMFLILSIAIIQPEKVLAESISVTGEWEINKEGKYQVEKSFTTDWENYGLQTHPVKMYFKVVRKSKNTFTIGMKLTLEKDNLLTWGSNEYKFYINNEIVQQYNGVGQLPAQTISWDEDREFNEKSDVIKLKIYFQADYAQYHNSDTRELIIPIYDSEKPVVQVDKDYYNGRKISFTVTDNRNVDKIHIKKPDGNTEAFANGTTTYTATAEGQYEIWATDESGNKSEVKTFEVDETNPTLSNYQEYINKSTVFKFNDKNQDRIEYTQPNGENKKVYSDTLNITTDKDGKWSFYAVDKAGNMSAVYKVIVDTTKPVARPYNEYTNKKMSISFEEKNIEKIVVTNPNNEIQNYNANQYTQDINIDGIWSFYAVDKAGNQSITYKVIVDTTKPIIESFKEYINSDEIIKVKDINLLEIVVTSPTGEINKYNTNEYIQKPTKEGKWSFYAVDKAGNMSAVYKVIVDITKPVIGLRKANGEALVDGGYNNTGVYFDPEDKYYSHLVLYKKENESWSIVSSSYIVGSVYFDKREVLNLFDSRKIAIEYITSKEIKRIENKSNWSTEVVGVILDSQKDLAYQGSDYYIYHKDDGSDYIFFDYSDLLKHLKVTAKEYLESESREVFNSEGFYKVEVFDKAGNSSFKTFTIDKQIPTGSFFEFANGSITNREEIIFRFEEEGIDVFDNNIKIAATWDILSKTFKVTLTEAGLHNIVLKDKAGNVSNYNIYIDRDKVEIIEEDTVLDGIKYSNKKALDLTFYDGVGISEIKVNDENIEITNRRKIQYQIKEEKEYQIVAIDKAGNETNIKIIIDRVLPEFEIIGQYTLEDNTVYCNSSLEYKVRDNTLLDSVKENTKNGDILLENDFVFNKENGRYKITAVDKAGNINVINIVCYKTDSFGNEEKIKDLYKISSWYRVVLPGYIFNVPGKENIAGTYNFKTYKQAFDFAFNKEKEYRVQEISPGEYIYISLSNETISQKYNDIREVDKVVSHYAEKYISDKIYLKYNQNENIGYLVDEDGNISESAFSSNAAKIPEFLTEDRIYQINSSFVFSVKSNPFNIDNFAKLIYIADDFAIQEEVILEIKPKESILDALKRNEHLKQGYYRVVEYDKCLNEISYLIYFDLEKPTIKAEVTLGDNTKINIDFNEDYIKANQNTLRYISFDIKEIVDNIDTTFTIIKIQGSKIDNCYDNKDKLPVLNYQNGYSGIYQIQVFDRSFNLISFEINIAGENPTWEYSSLLPNTEKLTISFLIHDKKNLFTEIEIFKISRDGEKHKLTTDMNGKEISANHLTYKFLEGGKYGARMKDLFGRVIYTKAIFYQRGLPSGTLSIDNESITNKEVNFSYLDKYNLIVYQVINGEKVIFSDYVSSYDEVKKRHKITFLAPENIDTRSFLINLNDKKDPSLFIEYTFGIDTYLSESRIVESVTNKVIEKGGATNKGFVIDYEDLDLIVKYSLNGDFARTYHGEELINDGKYLITVKDLVGNKETYVVYIDSKVDYKINGKYKVIDGNYISNDNIIVEAKEILSNWKVVSDNNVTVNQGDEITEDGRYEITMTDNYANTEIVVIIIDKTNPIITLIGVEENGVTKGEVTTKGAAGDIIELYKKSTLVRRLEVEDKICEEGDYKIVVTDIVGNSNSVKFKIDKSVDVSLSLPNQGISSETVYLSVKEEVIVKTILNGKEIDNTKRSYKEIGEYTLIINDLIGNEKRYDFIIIKKGYKYLKLDYKDNTLKYIKKDNNVLDKKDLEFKDTGKWEVSMLNNQGQEFSFSFKIDSDKPKVEIKKDKNKIKFANLSKENAKGTLYINGKKQDKFSFSKEISEPGKYKLVLIDDYGNENTYQFEIKKKINTYGLIGLGIVLIIIVGGLAYGIISKRVKSY